MSTVSGADRLILFADEQVRDHDRHQELLERNDLYREPAATELATA
ncbi:hypothetical protein ACH4SP_14785 [Streptomyces sp. NPDC021093]